MSRISTRLETLTPDKAQRWLDNRAPNRPLSKLYARELANSIQVGEWERNGATIVFNSDGKMEDGQHRCLAVVMAGKSIDVIVVRGVAVGSFDSIDTGRGRTAAHLLARDGEKHYAVLASALRWLNLYNHGTFQSNGSGWALKLTRHQLRQLLDTHPGIRDFCVLPKNAGGIRGTIPSGIIAAFHYIGSSIDVDLAETYFHGLMTGENIGKSSWSWQVRERLFAAFRSTAQRLHTSAKAEIVVRGWNAARSGRKPGIVKILNEFVAMK